MKNEIIKHQKMRAINRILDNNAEIFSGKTEAVLMKDLFGQQLDKISLLISDQLKPSATIHKPKQELQRAFHAETVRMIGMGIMLASNLKNQSLLYLLRNYKTKMHSVSAYRKYEIALHVHDEIKKHQPTAGNFGLTEEVLNAFKDMAIHFAGTLEDTGNSLYLRKKDRAQLNHLLKQCNETLRNQLDPFIGYHQLTHPEVFQSYMLLRDTKAPKRKKPVLVNQKVEIVGTVTNALTGKAVKDAVINLVGFDMATETDADGYYLFEDLPETSFTVSCHCAGYQLPEPVTFQAKAGENLVVDFSLTPAS